jgi:hypothetical protein
MKNKKGSSSMLLPIVTGSHVNVNLVVDKVEESP